MLHGNNADRSNRYHPHPHHPHQHKVISTERFNSSNSQQPTVITVMKAALSVTAPSLPLIPNLLFYSSLPVLACWSVGVGPAAVQRLSSCCPAVEGPSTSLSEGFVLGD